MEMMPPAGMLTHGQKNIKIREKKNGGKRYLLSKWYKNTI